MSRVSVTRCHTNRKDIQSTVVLMREFGSESLNARISIRQTKVKSLGGQFIRRIMQP